jgi:hypothetical protein
MTDLWTEEQEARWQKYHQQWEATYEDHHSPSGWATLGAQVRDGICQCPVCQVVRAHREETQP